MLISHSKNVIILSNAKVTQVILHNFCKKQNTKRIIQNQELFMVSLNEEQTSTILMQNRLTCYET